MKSGKTFTIDLDILLRKPSSNLVNNLLKEFYGKNKEDCVHMWSNWFTTAKGLTRECQICHKLENKKNGE